MDKTCTKCGETKTVTEFYPARNGQYGVRGDCKQCVGRVVAEYKKNNAEATREYSRAYNRTEAGQERRERYLARLRMMRRERHGGALPHETPYKLCPKCGEEKLRATDFYQRSRGGVEAYCKPCHHKYQYQRYLARRHEGAK